MNVDASVKKDGAVIAVVRDSNGRVIKMWPSWIASDNSEAAELAAFHFAISKAIDEGWKCIECEGDAFSIVKALAN